MSYEIPKNSVMNSLVNSTPECPTSLIPINKNSLSSSTSSLNSVSSLSQSILLENFTHSTLSPFAIPFCPKSVKISNLFSMNSEPSAQFIKQKSFCNSVKKQSRIIRVKNDNRPYTIVDICDQAITGLLDSGAQVTVIGSDLADIVLKSNVHKENSSIIIKTVDGTQHQVTAMVNLEISYNKQKKILNVLLVPSLPNKLILGMDFWAKFDIRPIVCNISEITKNVPVKDDHNLSVDQASALQSVIQTLPFSAEGKLSRTHLMTHTIDTGDAKPLKQRHYSFSPFIQDLVNKEIDRLLELDVIEKCSTSSWSNPVVAVKKPNGKIRVCLDARKLNEATIKDAYPQPQINRILSRLVGTKYLSSIDFSDAFLQVPLEESSRPKTAFAISGKGFFVYKRMAFGLCNSGATLCRLVDQVIGCDLEPFVFVYLDDIIIATPTFEKHIEMLRILSRRIKASGLTISAEKSKFCSKQLRYLGYIVAEDGIRPDPEKISSIMEYAKPKNVKDVRRLLGMAGWYRRFIENFAVVTAPLTELLKKNKGKFVWNEKAEESFEALKKILTSNPVLKNPDYTKPFIVQCDASDHGVGAVLVQGEGEDEHTIAYMSQKLSATQKKYHTTERECLAVILAIEKFRPYIEGTKFTVITDHASLRWLQNLKDPAGRVGRWALRLQAHDFELKHRKGKFMVVADALSRSIESVEVEKFNESNDAWYVKLVEGVNNFPDRFPHYRLEKNVLYKHCNLKLGSNDKSRWRIIVPKEKRMDVLKLCHDDVLSAHMGYHKTIDRIRRTYTWPALESDVRKYISACETCKASKASNVLQTAPMGERRKTVRPWQMIHIDFIGPLPRSKKGFCHLLVVVDSFSKFVHVHPVRNATTSSVIEFLENRIFLIFGVPEIVVCDNGPQFIAKDFKTFLEGYNIKTWYTARYHPQANAAEAANKTIGIAIRSYIKDNDDHRNWDKNLYKITCAMNTAVHSMTGFAPYFVNFGCHMITNGKEYSVQINDDQESDDEGTDFEQIRKAVIKNLEKAYDTSKKRYDLRTRPINYQIGDTVWKKNFIQSDASKNIAAKLAPKFLKCIVKRKVGGNCYELADESGKSLGVFNSRVLKQ